MEFDQQKLASALDILQLQAMSPPLLKFSLHIFEQVGSTNKIAWDLIDDGAGPGTVVIAVQQEAGKGQWGRQWLSSPGGLYLSLVIAPNFQVEDSLLLTLCSAWGIAQVYRDRHIPVFLKWPNDLILCDRKLGGILTETRIRQRHITTAVIGVGINWANTVPEIGINLQSFITRQNSINNTETITIDSLEMLAAYTLQGLNYGYQFAISKDRKYLIDSYQSLLTNIGKPIVIDGKSGILKGLAPNGDLRVLLQPELNLPIVEIELKPGTISLGYHQEFIL